MAAGTISGVAGGGPSLYRDTARSTIRLRSPFSGKQPLANPNVPVRVTNRQLSIPVPGRDDRCDAIACSAGPCPGARRVRRFRGRLIDGRSPCDGLIEPEAPSRSPVERRQFTGSNRVDALQDCYPMVRNWTGPARRINVQRNVREGFHRDIGTQ